VSPILFTIYLSGVFDAIERRVNGIQCLSFADDIGLLALGYSVREVCDKCDGLTLYRRQDEQTVSMELTTPPCKQIKKVLALQLKRTNADR